MSENNVPDSEKKRIFGKIKSFLPGKKEHDVEKEFPIGRTVIVKPKAGADLHVLRSFSEEG